MKIINKKFFGAGIAILIILLISYLIKIPIDSGLNFKTLTPLLAILIFKNPIILILYLLMGIILILLGVKKIKFI